MKVEPGMFILRVCILSKEDQMLTLKQVKKKKKQKEKTDVQVCINVGNAQVKIQVESLKSSDFFF